MWVVLEGVQVVDIGCEPRRELSKLEHEEEACGVDRVVKEKRGGGEYGWEGRVRVKNEEPGKAERRVDLLFGVHGCCCKCVCCESVR